METMAVSGTGVANLPVTETNNGIIACMGYHKNTAAGCATRRRKEYFVMD